METIKFKIRPYLAEYLMAKYAEDPAPDNELEESAAHFGRCEELYCLLYDLLKMKPKNASPPVEHNIVVAIPCKRNGKDPKIYNYISTRGVKEFDSHVKLMFDMELHHVIYKNIHQGRKKRNIDVVHEFIDRYNLKSISADGLLKNFNRHNRKVKESYLTEAQVYK